MELFDSKDGGIVKKVELLCPVGNRDMLYQAIHNGADAVYLAGKSFGARKFANNFNDNELIDTIKYSHLYGVKVYVTVNTMIYESEIDKLFNYLIFLHKNGVDAVIMQDIGVIKRVREVLPNLEVHASTQCHNHNEEGIKLLKDLGVTRVVMAREMSLDEINSINVDIEKEVFVYGALCVCYSGCCLFSSMNGGRSGNRGECVGSCRLAYDLYENDKKVNTNGNYLISTRDLNTISNLKEILDSGIDSLKIEGRMKSPYYVGYVTRIYRKLIDLYYENKNIELKEYELNNLKKLFNRKYTSGFLFNDKNIVNIESPNHIGVSIGKVINIDKKKIYIKLDSDELNQEDGIRFKNAKCGMIVNMLYNKNDLLVNHMDKGSICAVDNKFDVKVGDIVLKTIDSKLIKTLDSVEEKKIDVSYRVLAKLGKPLEIIINDIDNNEIVVNGGVCENASNRPITYEDIIKQLGKLGNTPFRLKDLECDIDDNIFITLSELNNLRRELVNKLIDIRENKKVDVVINNREDNYNISNNYDYKINVLVRNEEQLLCCIDNNVDNIYVVDYLLYCKYRDKYNNIFFRTSRVNNCKMDFKDSKLLVCELGGINKYSNNNYVVSDYYLNVANRYSIDILSSLGVDRVTLSVELDDYETLNIMDKCSGNIEMIIYGRIELMIMKYCPLKEIMNNCSICKNNYNKYYLVNKDKRKYPVIHSNCYTSIMHYENIDKINKINQYMKYGINNYRIELFDEDKDGIIKLIDMVRRNFT